MAAAAEEEEGRKAAKAAVAIGREGSEPARPVSVLISARRQRVAGRPMALLIDRRTKPTGRR